MLTILTLVLGIGGVISFEPYIVGGKTSLIETYPHSAFLEILCSKQGDLYHWICSGSIIHKYVMLSAAHCFEHCGTKSAISVAVGSAKREHGQLYSVAQLRIHPYYDTRTVQNDIMALRMRRPFHFSNKVNNVELVRNPKSVTYAYVAGWGVTDLNDEISSEVLKETWQTVFSLAYCEKLLKKIPKGTLCAGSKSNYVAEGDSGSALVIRNGSADGLKHVQIGIVSYKLPQISHSVSVYTSVPHYYDWILKQLNKLLIDTLRTSEMLPTCIEEEKGD